MMDHPHTFIEADRPALALTAPVAFRWATPAASWPRRVPAIAAGVVVHAVVLWLVMKSGDVVLGDPAGEAGITIELVNAADDVPRSKERTVEQGSAASTPAPTNDVASQNEPEPPTGSSPPVASQPPTPKPQVQAAAQSPRPPLPIPNEPSPVGEKGLDDVLKTPIDRALPPLKITPPKLDRTLPTVGKAIAAAPAPKRDPFASPLDRYIARQNRSSAAAGQGVTDAFVVGVTRLIEQRKPVSNGWTGRLIVGFRVAFDGRLEALRLVQSSGEPRLDALVLKSLDHAMLITPPADATVGDRTFEIAFTYR